MEFKSLCCRKLFCATVLFLGSAASASGEPAASGVADAPTLEHDFVIVSATKDKTHPYHDQGTDIGFTVNGVQGGTVVVERGKSYTFGVDTGVKHDFYLATKPMGFGTGTLTKGVKGNFTYKGTVTFNPTVDTPDTVYYACRNHKYMGGDIQVVNRGEAGKPEAVKPAEKH